MTDQNPEVDLDNVIDRLLEGESLNKAQKEEGENS